MIGFIVNESKLTEFKYAIYKLQDFWICMQYDRTDAPRPVTKFGLSKTWQLYLSCCLKFNVLIKESHSTGWLMLIYFCKGDDVKQYTDFALTIQGISASTIYKIIKTL